MASTQINFIVSIILILTIHFSSSPVKSVNVPPFASSVCTKTTQPNYCKQCLNDLPSRKMDTVKDIADVSIDCAKINANMVYDAVFAYKVTTNYPEAEACLSAYTGVKDVLNLAGGSLRGGRVDETKGFLESAKNFYNSCSVRLVKGKRVVPKDLSVRFKNFIGYVDSARGVVGQIV